MKIVVVGAAGTIGAAVTAALEANKHEVIRASRKLAPRIDISDPQSIRRFFAEVKDLDGVVSCAGDARFAPLDKLTDEDFLFSVSNKLMGQVNLIRAALPVIRDNGSITVTSGVLAKYPMIGSGAVSLVNAGLEGFTRVAALEATRAVRVNVVSPGWVKETMVKFGMDPTPGKAAVDVNDEDEEQDYYTNSDWVLVTSDGAIFHDPAFKSSSVQPVRLRPNLRPWTDDYSNLFQILKILDK